MTNLLGEFDPSYPAQDELQSAIETKRLQRRLQYTLNREQRFANQAAHELNTPLTIINAYFDMAEDLAKKGDTTKVQDVLKKAKVGIKQLQLVVQQLLVLSRLDDIANKSQKHTQNRSTVLDIVYDALANLSGSQMSRVKLPDNLPKNDCDIQLELGSTALKNLIEHVLVSSQSVDIQVKTNQDKVYFIISDIDFVENEAVYIDKDKEINNLKEVDNLKEIVTLKEIETLSEIQELSIKIDTLEKKYKNYNKILEDSSFLNYGLNLTIVASIAELYNGELLQETTLSQNLPSKVGQRWILVLNLLKLY